MAIERASVSRRELRSELREIGVRAGTSVMLHASLRAVGKVEGGPPTLIEAILDVLGAEGTLLMLVGSKGALYDIAEWPVSRGKTAIAARAPYDPAHTPANPEWGVVGEVLRTWDNSQRSQHPDYSFVAVGRMANYLTSDHPYDYCHGPSSPLGKLCDVGGEVLFVGAPFQSVTLVHLCEHLAAVSRKQVISCEAPILREGRRELVSIERFDTRHCIPGYKHDDYFEPIAREYLDCGLGRSGKVGSADSFLLDVQTFRDFGVSWLERHLPPAA